MITIIVSRGVILSNGGGSGGDGDNGDSGSGDDGGGGPLMIIMVGVVCRGQ